MNSLLSSIVSVIKMFIHLIKYYIRIIYDLDFTTSEIVMTITKVFNEEGETRLTGEPTNLKQIFYKLKPS